MTDSKARTIEPSDSAAPRGRLGRGGADAQQHQTQPEDTQRCPVLAAELLTPQGGDDCGHADAARDDRLHQEQRQLPQRDDVAEETDTVQREAREVRQLGDDADDPADSRGGGGAAGSDVVVVVVAAPVVAGVVTGSDGITVFDPSPTPAEI